MAFMNKAKTRAHEASQEGPKERAVGTGESKAKTGSTQIKKGTFKEAISELREDPQEGEAKVRGGPVK